MQDLKKLNYTSNEIKVYLELLQEGPLLAGKIAAQTHLDRSSVYHALKKLISKGVISTVYENKRTCFIPQKPQSLFHAVQEQEEIAKRIIPDLEKESYFSAKHIGKQGGNTSKTNCVKLFQGYRGLQTIFNDILDSCDEKSTYRVMCAEGFMGRTMPHFACQFRMRKEEKKIACQVLIRHGRQKKKKGKYSTYRMIPSDVESPETINIYANKVAIFIWDENPHGILIENDAVTKTFENYFRFIWKSAKQVKIGKKES